MVHLGNIMFQNKWKNLNFTFINIFIFTFISPLFTVFINFMTLSNTVCRTCICAVIFIFIIFLIFTFICFKILTFICFKSLIFICFKILIFISPLTVCQTCTCTSCPSQSVWLVGRRPGVILFIIMVIDFIITVTIKIIITLQE